MTSQRKRRAATKVLRWSHGSEKDLLDWWWLITPASGSTPQELPVEIIASILAKTSIEMWRRAKSQKCIGEILLCSGIKYADLIVKLASALQSIDLSTTSRRSLHIREFSAHALYLDITIIMQSLSSINIVSL